MKACNNIGLGAGPAGPVLAGPVLRFKFYWREPKSFQRADFNNTYCNVLRKFQLPTVQLYTVLDRSCSQPMPTNANYEFQLVGVPHVPACGSSVSVPNMNRISFPYFLAAILGVRFLLA